MSVAQPAGPVPNDPDESEDRPMSLRAKAIAGFVGAVILTACAWALLRVSSPPIAAGQARPAGHYSLSCGFCHAVSAASSEVVR